MCAWRRSRSRQTKCSLRAGAIFEFCENPKKSATRFCGQGGLEILMNRERLLDIDRATGIAIALVVLGHLAPGRIYSGAEWYYSLKSVIYTFHMPFFMYLSGVVAYYTYKPAESVKDYKAYVYKKSCASFQHTCCSA